MEKLNIQVKYSALYRPEAIGILERQHRSIKDSLKSAIQDLADKHQGRWLDFLPFIVLAKNSTLQQDIQTSPSELAFGTTVRIPGQLLRDPAELSGDQLQDLLHQTKKKTAENVFQTSSARTTVKERPLRELPDGISHVYVRQHKTTGLQSPFEGPFLVVDRPSRSTIKIEVGTLKNGDKRYEARHLNDIKLCHPDSPTSPVVRSKLGRPSKNVEAKQQNQTNQSVSVGPEPPVSQPTNVNNGGTSDTRNHETSTSIVRVPAPGKKARENSNGPPPNPPFPRHSTKPLRSTRNSNPNYVDAIWVASPADLQELNRAISRSSG